MYHQIRNLGILTIAGTALAVSLLAVSLLAVSLLAVSLLAEQANAQSADTLHLSLSDAIHMAIQNSTGMVQSEAGLDEAKARYREIRSYAYPQLAGDATYTRIDPVVTIAFGNQSFSTMPHDNYNGALNLQQPLWSFGRFQAEYDVAESTIKSATDNLDLAKEQTAYQTTRAYYGLLTTDKAITVEQEQVRVLQGNLSDAQKRQAQGTATSLDVLNIEARLSQTQSQIADLQSTRQKQVAMMRRLLGMAPGQNIAVSQPAPAAALPQQEDSLLSLAEKQRAELVTAEDAENTARLQVVSARNNDDPLLTTNITGGVKDGYLPDLTQPKLNWAGTVSLHVPILDGGRTHAQVDEAEAEYRAAQARTEDAKRGVQSDIEQALADLASSQERLNLVQSQIDQAQQAYKIAQVRYQNGVATNLDVLTAQSAVEQAELEQAQLQYNFEVSQYDLNRAVGTVIW